MRGLDGVVMVVVDGVECVVVVVDVVGDVVAVEVV